MSNRPIKRTSKQLAPEKLAELRRVRDLVVGEKDEIIAKGKKYKEQHNAVLSEAAKVLKAEREARGWSLADLESRTGIDRATLSRFETGVCGNPTIATLNRYASALGKQLVVSLRDQG
jgi:ribosome-binding protein aMBF1 (putative translation factor)